MFRLLLLLVVVCCLNSCIYLRTSSQSYQATVAPPSVGGARFRAEFIPRGSGADLSVTAVVIGGAAIHENGPYQLRLHAFGQKGDQRWFRVTRFKLTVPDRLDAPMDRQAFEGETAFEPAATPGVTRASLLFGTRIHINTAEHKDKELAVEADVEVMRRGGLARGTLRIPMTQSRTARTESFFIPTEIVRSFREKTPADIPNALPPPPEAP